MRRIHLLKRLFHIQPVVGKGSGDVLLCELSHHHICLALAGLQSKEITALSYFETVTPLSAQDFTEALRQVSFNGFQKMVVSSAFPEVVLLPEHLFAKKRAAELLQMTEEPVKDPVFYNVLDDQNVVVIFSVPKPIQQKLVEGREPEMTHVYTCQLRQQAAFAQDQIYVHFESREFRVLAKKDQQLLLIQTYGYSTPLDVVYYLLAVCREFDLSQSLTALVVSGLVDVDSAMYKELHQYFSQIHFAGNDAIQLPGNEYPKHFFSSIHNLAACAL